MHGKRQGMARRLQQHVAALRGRSTMSGRMRWDRRGFLRLSGASLAGAAALGDVSPAPAWAAGEAPPLGAAAAVGVRTWLGSDFWANRLQDWRLNGSRIEGPQGGGRGGGRTVAGLARGGGAGGGQGEVTVRAGALASGF